MSEYLLIASHPDILSGMVVVRGTRIGVRFLRALRAHGAPESELLHDFPSLTPDTLRAVLELSEETIAALEARVSDPLMPALVQGAEVMAELARRAHLVSAEDYAALLGRSPDDVLAADASGHLLGVPWGDRRGYPAAFMRDGRLPPVLPDALKTLRRTTSSAWAMLEALLVPWPDGSNLLMRLWNDPPETVIETICRWAGTSET